MESLEDTAARPSSTRLTRWTLRGIGFFLVGLALLGVLLPLLPTTIFLLGAAACFAKASPAAHRWLHGNRLFGRYLRDYREHRGATLTTKLVSLATLWLGLAISAYFIGPMLVADIALAAVGIGVSWHLVSLKTLKH
jgi:uncharacterized membrane protein YbaN (DUF454 family)